MRSGGGNRVRTGDLMLAKHVLYQLSYAPRFSFPIPTHLNSIRFYFAPEMVRLALTYISSHLSLVFGVIVIPNDAPVVSQHPRAETIELT